ncbi:MAG: hypothetical protein KAX31_04610 [Thermoplasmata archaeon]|nr:hypothetical protein [Thermoplasmata archaeon]
MTEALEKARAELLEHTRLPKGEQDWIELAGLRAKYKRALKKSTNDSATVDLGPDLSEDENYVTPTRIHLAADGTKYLTDRRVKLSGFYHAEGKSG